MKTGPAEGVSAGGDDERCRRAETDRAGKLGEEGARGEVRGRRRELGREVEDGDGGLSRWKSGNG